MDEILITATNLGLKIPVFKPSEQKIGSNPIKIMAEFYSNRSNRDIRELLSNVSFVLKRGESLGVMGRNGSGKTTLLRLICGVYKSNVGTLEIHAKTQGLFDFKMGMQNDATGIENIYLRGLQMGLELKQIRNLIPEVIEFASIGSAINDVFSTYSTGMRLRLAGAISTMIVPDILVLDEWVGSGDQEFRSRLDKRMDRIIGDSKGLIIATHSEALIRRLCSNVLILDQGKSTFFGPTDEGIEFYKKSSKT